MMSRIAAALLVLPWLGGADAHNLDEYVQAAVVGMEPDRIEVSLRLVPGVAVFPELLEAMDLDSDGILSPAERQLYVERLRKDLVLRLDGRALSLQPAGISFPTLEQMRAGLGEIRIRWVAPIPPGAARRQLVLENHHQPRISAYLMNCLVPDDPRIEVVAQRRNPSQSHYEVDYRQVAGR